jgi:hypothetical protein
MMSDPKVNFAQVATALCQSFFLCQTATPTPAYTRKIPITTSRGSSIPKYRFTAKMLKKYCKPMIVIPIMSPIGGWQALSRFLSLMNADYLDDTTPAYQAE